MGYIISFDAPMTTRLANPTLKSSRVYHINPQHLRDLQVEISGGRGRRRTRDNAYDKTEFEHLSREEKQARYDTLKESISKGYNPEFPILIMLRREGGEDKLFEGHHRLNIAIELQLETIPVRFIEHQKEYNNKGRVVVI